MAYCPKCGVELEGYIKNCPLCNFGIPDVGEPGYFFGEEVLEKYPHAISMSRKDQRMVRNKLFFSFLVVVISAVFILGIIKLVYPGSAIVVNYTMLAFISILFYMFFLFGYLKPIFNLIGLMGTTLFVTYSMDYQMESVTWYKAFAWPITFVLFADLALFLFLYKKSRKRNQFIYVPSLSLLFMGLLSIGVDSVISIHLGGTIHLSWSLIVLISTGAISGILLGVYHGLPEKSKAWMKRKLHV